MSTSSPSRPSPSNTPDPLTTAGWLCFLLMSGVLVFGFAAAQGPAAKNLEDAACRPLAPSTRPMQAPELELVDRSGKARRLSEFRGKFVVLNFWATWCEPCTREWPDLDRLSERLEGRDDVVVVAVTVDEDEKLIEPYLARMALQGTQVEVLRDPTGTAHKQFGSDKLPDTFFVDETGRVTHVFVNVRAWGRPAALRCVESRVGRAT